MVAHQADGHRRQPSHRPSDPSRVGSETVRLKPGIKTYIFEMLVGNILEEILATATTTMMMMMIVMMLMMMMIAAITAAATLESLIQEPPPESLSHSDQHCAGF